MKEHRRGSGERQHAPRVAVCVAATHSLLLSSCLFFVAAALCSCSFHRVPETPATSAPLPEMSGYKVIFEVAVLVVMVLSVGTTAALTAN